MTPQRRALWAVVVVGAVALVLLMVYGVAYIAEQSKASAEDSAAIRESQKTGRKIAVGNAAVLDRILDCTTPGRECYDRSQAQVANINRITILAAACADRPAQQSVEQIQQCVIRRLADEPPPSNP